MRKKIAHIVVTALLIATPAVFSALADTNSSIVRNLDIFNSLYKELNTFYVDSLDAKKSIETAINAMLDDIDPYTEYIPAQERDEFLTLSTGEYGGIGSYIQQRKDGSVIFTEPYENSPAARAGIKPGDRIIMIDADSTTGWNNSRVSENLKGQSGTHVKVVVDRPYETDSIITLDIVREKIKVNPVPYYGMVADKVGYIALTTFNEHSAEEVKNALIDLTQNRQAERIILDLRSNGGGLLESAIKIVGFFVPKGTQVLQTRGKTKQDEKTYKTTEAPIVPDMPLAVLIDEGSASAAEITAGALQDLDRAALLGARSFGKGLVQTTRPLPFNSMLKVTIAKYYIPSGRLIQEIDYSKRDDRGDAQRVPDSLTNVFHTAHGREVRDGGGITPDIVIKQPEANRLVYNIVRDSWDFDFATKFAAEHPTIEPADKFEITDEIYNDFKQFIDPDKFAYDKVCEQGLQNLRKVAEAEGYMNDSTKAEFDRLEQMLKHNLDQDLDNNRKRIEPFIAKEIVKRYYYQKGQIVYMLRHDNVLDKAVELLGNDTEYAKLLRIDLPKKKTSAAAKPSKKNTKKSKRK